MIDLLPPLPVVGTLAIAGLLLVTERVLPRPVPDIIAVLTALGSALICVVMAIHTGQQPLVYWFGGWAPGDGQVLGIGFVVEQPDAAFGAFIGLLFAATLIFAWGYYDEVKAHFHVLMLLFMAGMIGFCLTHDLFNMFVWFEVLSVAGFAATGYALRGSALTGALNFTVVNTIGSYLFLGGLGLVYARVGALDFSALEKGVAASPQDAVISAAFALLAMGLLIKAAQVPFQFWLSDAHAVAPSPVSVIFSGAMVSLGVYGIAKLTYGVFSPSPAITAVVHSLVLAMGVASAVLGGIMALIQRHLKRLLAFSTISHTGIMVIGLALLQHDGLAGLLVYLFGHGLVKGALFMVAGILLALRGGIDEIDLRGMGCDIWPAGAAMALGGVLLAGLPLGLMHEGIGLIAEASHADGQPWLIVPVMLAEALTGGAVLRACGRIFLGLGAVSGQETAAPTEEEQEKADRPLWLMLLPAAVLLLLALPFQETVSSFARGAAQRFMHPDPDFAAHSVLGSPPSEGAMAWIPVVVAVLIAGAALHRDRLPRAVMLTFDRGSTSVLRLLNNAHSGLIGDYVAWIVAGLALFAAAFAFVN